jgi:hypothetical protein
MFIYILQGAFPRVSGVSSIFLFDASDGDIAIL